MRGVKSRNALGKENAALLRRWVLARNVQARLGGTAGQHVYNDPDNRRARSRPMIAWAYAFSDHSAVHRAGIFRVDCRFSGNPGVVCAFRDGVLRLRALVPAM